MNTGRKKCITAGNHGRMIKRHYWILVVHLEIVIKQGNKKYFGKKKPRSLGLRHVAAGPGGEHHPNQLVFLRIVPHTHCQLYQ
mmetsp:Transcript_12047/g.19377  ORF Transcript_12047/g.19377 Transcript_12047/m.19377 type:complete len:83 (+) Transcript_12047:322-570(+)